MSPTRYTVVSSDEADDELTVIWLNHPMAPNLRMMDHGPLRVRFEVSEPDRMVRIVGYEKLTVNP
jgi:hypothetical protein